MEPQAKSGAVEKPMASFMKHIMPYTKDKRVLDIGCNNGIYLEFFSENSVGVDFDEDYLAQCREKGLDARKTNLGPPSG